MKDLLEGITWLGHASFKISGPEGLVYIDPRNLKTTEAADLILITHGHSDHFAPDDVKRIRTPSTTVVTIAEVAAKLQGSVRTVKPGDKLTVAGIAIEVVPAYNPAKAFHPPAAGGVGFIVTIGGRRVYHAGDTDVIPEMHSIQTDVALLPVAGKYTMDPHEAAKAADIIKPAVAVPMHWGDLIGTRADAEAFRDRCHVPVQILDVK